MTASCYFVSKPLFFQTHGVRLTCCSSAQSEGDLPAEWSIPLSTAPPSRRPHRRRPRAISSSRALMIPERVESDARDIRSWGSGHPSTLNIIDNSIQTVWLLRRFQTTILAMEIKRIECSRRGGLSRARDGLFRGSKSEGREERPHSPRSFLGRNVPIPNNSDGTEKSFPFNLTSRCYDKSKKGRHNIQSIPAINFSFVDLAGQM